MAPEINVGQADRVIRIILGLVCVGLVAYHFLREPILPIYAIIGLVILIAYFLKTGYTRVCPIMKSMNVSTTKKQN
jgi:uncharacterized membrane protein YeiB